MAEKKLTLYCAQPQILFCDNHILIALKPNGMLTQPDHTQHESLEAFAKAWVKQKYDKPGEVFLHVIHRLDRPVSGLLLFARTSKALSRLNQQSREHQIQRRYLALIEGHLKEEKGILEHYLIHGDHRAIVSEKGQPEAKYAHLSYEVVDASGPASLVSIELTTGRYHQIRAQFAAIGHPVVGDQRYGSQVEAGGKIALQCNYLHFKHPVTQEPLDFKI